MTTPDQTLPKGMERVADATLGLVRPEDVMAYREMLQAIKGGRSVLFLGAGPSSYHYGTWDELVDDLLDRARLIPLPNETIFETVDRCQQRLGPGEYANVLLKRFDRKPADAPGTVYDLLARVNFDAFVTTNFDCCLEYAGEDAEGIVGRVYEYPNDYSVANIGQRCVFHVHGRIVPGKTDAASLRVVLSESEYERAYQTRTELRVLVSELLCASDRTVVFYGTGFRDHSLLFESVKRGHDELKKTISALRDDGRGIRTRRHFAFASVPTFDERSRYGLAYWQEGVDARLDGMGSVLRDYEPEVQIVPVLYADPNPRDKAMSHRFLTEILRDMRTECQYQGGKLVVEKGT